LVRIRIAPHAEPFELPPEVATPIVKWAGGKRSLRRQLLALIPPQFSNYFEPFMGGASFFLALASVQEITHAVVNDANCELVKLYEMVRDHPETLMLELDRLQIYVLDEQFYYVYRNIDLESLSPVQRAARFVYLNKTCYNGLYRVNQRGQFNVPFGRYSSPPSLYNRANMVRVAGILRRAQLDCGDFTESLKSAGTGDFVYLDPPYVPLTTTASFTRYTRGDFDAGDQRRLANTVHDLTERGCKVLLSNSETALVRELYSDARYDITVVYAPRNINSDSNSRQKIAELAIRNYRATRWDATRCEDGAGQPSPS
jgi:DNA adenine methylase